MGLAYIFCLDMLFLIHLGEHGIFGVPLAIAVSRMPSHDGVPLPVVVRRCVDYIYDNGN